MSTSTAHATETSSTSGHHEVTLSPNLKIVGIILAILSGFLIGSSFVFKKKGLLASQGDGKLGEGVGYLKSFMWWTGMIMMIVGEICNFAAYSFVEAIVVTPMGALSVVICAILSHFFLNESLTTFGAIGCALCIVGSVVIALNGPKEATVGQILEFQKLFLSPGFLVWGGVVIVASLVIIFYFAPKYGEKSMLWYISVCSLIGGLSVSCTTGLGAAIVTSVMGDNQFKHWFIYFLLIFVTITLITEIFYLNKALALFNTALVTPTYYVLFTSATLISSIVLFQGLKAPAQTIITLVMGFLTICLGITLLQMSKVDPTTLKLDRRSTILLQAARRPTELQEKSIAGFEDPGMDALRGGFGTVGSIIRARSMRKSMIAGGPSSSPAVEEWRQRHTYTSGGEESATSANQFLSSMQRHQLYDAPVPRQSTLTMETQSDDISLGQPKRGHKSIKFGNEDTRHFYPTPGQPGTVHRDSVRTEPYAMDSFPRDSYAKDPYAKDSYSKDSYSKDSYSKDSYSKDSYAKDSYAKDSYNSMEMPGSTFAAQQNMSPRVKGGPRPLPQASTDPFSDGRFRERNGSQSEEDERPEEVPLTASLNKSYPQRGDPDEYREESFGLVGAPTDSVKLVSPRRK
ncbi:hypothetical protein FRC14_007470 [Serendipita sp. 396]|nr:hypothetical protein FRC14_007470 [Serendipita sp. 396]KAG8871211.1 hypothetical protein FRC20_010826 [Serendipita sp. 405]